MIKLPPGLSSTSLVSTLPHCKNFTIRIFFLLLNQELLSPSYIILDNSGPSSVIKFFNYLLVEIRPFPPCHLIKEDMDFSLVRHSSVPQ